MKKTLLLTTAFVILCCLVVQAQQKIITGKVTDDTGSGLPGVNIQVKGSTTGTITDQAGAYSLGLPANVGADGRLVFSFIGYLTEEVPIGTQSNIDIQLKTDIQTLSEVVVIGYGQQEKKDVTGSLSNIGTKDFNRGVIASPQDLLVGKIAGVQVTTGSGAPGSGSSIRIRGTGSITAPSDPLIVIDGFPVDSKGIDGLANPMATLNPNDIESFTVLKDASATAIYGLRASNGVIIITTKKGKEGKAQFSYNGNFSAASPMKYVSVMSGDEVRATASALAAAGTLPGLNAAALGRLGTQNTDWQKEIFQTALSHDHNLSVSGSYKNLPYRVSYGFTDQEGILKTTNFVRNSLNINLTPTFLDGDLKVTASMKGMYTKQNFGNTGAVGSAVSFDPTQPVMNGSSRWGGYFAWTGPSTTVPVDPNGDPITIATSNPVSLLNQTDNRSDVYRFLGNLQLDYRLRFFPAIKITLNTGYDYSSSTGHNNAPDNAAWTFGNGLGQKIDYTAVNKSRLFDLYANYVKEIGSHKFDVTAGYSYQSFERDGSNFQRNGNETIFTDSQLGSDGVTPQPRQYVSNPNTLLSFFGRVNYSFGDRYLITVSARDDASSRFAKQNRWVIFPAAAVAWRINKESFMANVDFVSDLKLRASYGVTGQQDVNGNNAYPYLSTYQQSNSTAQYQFGSGFYNTYRPQAYDADLRWETTAQLDIGLDFGILNNKITGTLDYFQRKTEDILNTIPLAAGSNFSNYLITNVGNLENKGYEVTLRYTPVKKNDFEWNVGLNFTYIENKVTKLLQTDDPTYIGVPAGNIGLQKNIQNIQVGYPIYSFFVYQQVYDQAGKPIEGLYVDRSGQGGVVTGTENNKYRFHKPQPDYLMGINSRLNYKKWDFYFSGRVSLGNYVYNNVAANANYSNLYYTTGYFNNLPTSVNDTKFFSLQSFSDYYVQNASFFKMDNISLGYSFDDLLSQKLKARVSFTVQNAFFITKYKGIDPELSGGIDNNIYPRPRTFLLGLNLSF
jgi:TonB-linked SusC/RagA family outer membrane protein